MQQLHKDIIYDALLLKEASINRAKTATKGNVRFTEVYDAELADLQAARTALMAIAATSAK